MDEGGSFCCQQLGQQLAQRQPLILSRFKGERVSHVPGSLPERLSVVTLCGLACRSQSCTQLGEAAVSNADWWQHRCYPLISLVSSSSIGL